MSTFVAGARLNRDGSIVKQMLIWKRSHHPLSRLPGLLDVVIRASLGGVSAYVSKSRTVSADAGNIHVE